MRLYLWVSLCARCCSDSMSARLDVCVCVCAWAKIPLLNFLHTIFCAFFRAHRRLQTSPIPNWVWVNVDGDCSLLLSTMPLLLSLFWRCSVRWLRRALRSCYGPRSIWIAPAATLPMQPNLFFLFFSVCAFVCVCAWHFFVRLVCCCCCRCFFSKSPLPVCLYVRVFVCVWVCQCVSACPFAVCWWCCCCRCVGRRRPLVSQAATHSHTHTHTQISALIQPQFAAAAFWNAAELVLVRVLSVWLPSRACRCRRCRFCSCVRRFASLCVNLCVSVCVCVRPPKNILFQIFSSSL